jgi:hypothetical protein
MPSARGDVRREAEEEPRRALALANVALQLTAPGEHHGYSGLALVPGSALVRALGPARRS